MGNSNCFARKWWIRRGQTSVCFRECMFDVVRRAFRLQNTDLTPSYVNSGTKMHTWRRHLVTPASKCTLDAVIWSFRQQNAYLTRSYGNSGAKTHTWRRHMTTPVPKCRPDAVIWQLRLQNAHLTRSYVHSGAKLQAWRGHKLILDKKYWFDAVRNTSVW